MPLEHVSGINGIYVKKYREHASSSSSAIASPGAPCEPLSKYIATDETVMSTTRISNASPRWNLCVGNIFEDHRWLFKNNTPQPGLADAIRVNDYDVHDFMVDLRFSGWLCRSERREELPGSGTDARRPELNGAEVRKIQVPRRTDERKKDCSLPRSSRRSGTSR